jgi:hypothetical protein
MPIAGFLGVERYLNTMLVISEGLRLNLPIALILQAKHWLCSARREAFKGRRYLDTPENDRFAV